MLGLGLIFMHGVDSANRRLSHALWDSQPGILLGPTGWIWALPAPSLYPNSGYFGYIEGRRRV